MEQASGPEYAVVKKANYLTERYNELLPEQKNGHVLMSSIDVANPYCYDIIGEIDSVSRFAQSNEIQTSEYSFAKETEGDRQPVRNDDYDVTGRAQNIKTSEDIYNHLQTNEYDSSIILPKGSKSCNDLKISMTKGEETTYDSTQKSNQSRVTDNIYNHLSQVETYSHVSARPTCMQTDQTYGKIK